MGGLVLVVKLSPCAWVPGGVVKVFGAFNIDVVGEVNKDELDWVGFDIAFNASSYNFS